MNSQFSFRRVRAIARKEVMHIVRDPFTLGLAVGLPAVLVIFFGFAINFDFRGIPLAVYDHDVSRQSRELVNVFSSSGYFRVLPGAFPGRPVEDVASERALGSLVLKPGFGKAVSGKKKVEVQVLVDGSDNQKAGVIAAYAVGIQQAYAERLTEEDTQAPAITLAGRYVFNPELTTAWFIVPGLMTVVIGLLAVLMTSLTVAREWENGSMELLLSTPVQPIEIVIGKILPYVVIVLVSILVVFLIALGVFLIPFRGSYTLFWSTGLLFLLVSLGQGIFISVVTRQQQKAMQASILLGLLPPLLLSGFIFPVENMPVFFHYLTALLPARWFITITRSVFLKGASFTELIVPITALGILSAVIISAAARKFKKDLEP